ncbi:MAG: VWA domain-containing protein [Polyangiaceae bacterium]
MSADPGQIREAWNAHWDDALRAWSKLVRLSPPRWCMTEEDEKREGLTGSFAQILLAEHAVILSARQIAALGLAPYPLEIMAHEVGHHVYCPGDLADAGRLVARVRRGLPGHELEAGMVSNLYEDILINDRLQRSAGLDSAAVWRVLRGDGASTPLWALYTTIYEHLWSLPAGDLSGVKVDARTDQDARLGARLVRVYAKNWLRGGGRFAALVLPYLQTDRPFADLAAAMDATGQRTGVIPDGLTEIDDDEDDAVHPAFDPELTGLSTDSPDPRTRSDGRSPRPRHRDLGEYGQLLATLGVRASSEDVASRYYRERALPYLVRYPTRRSPRARELLPEGLETWDPGSPLEQIDWVESLARSPVVVPGLTTVERVYGDSRGGDPERAPVDLYVGIDCSGSMPAPRVLTSYPALAGAIVSLSALRVGASVKVVLSGEPNGRTLSMPDFLRDEALVMQTLTSYLGTGIGFGVHRLAETFDAHEPRARPAHVLLLTDTDLYRLLDSVEDGKPGWDVARDALAAARGGGTVVLNTAPAPQAPPVLRLRAGGWGVHFVSSWEALVDFAREFSRRAYEEERR